MIGQPRMAVTRTPLLLVLVCLHSSVAGAQGGLATTEPKARSSLITCLEAAADYSAVYPTDVYHSPARDVAVVFRLDDRGTVKKLRASYIAVDVGKAAPPNYAITSAELDVTGKTGGVFRYSQTGDMPLGKYRIEVTADGRPWRSAEFRVDAAVRADAVRAESLHPLTVGHVRKYDFVMEPRAGVKIGLPGIEPDAAGRLRAKVTVTAARNEDAGTHMELRRNDQLVFDEWLRWTDSGLVAAQRKVDGKIILLVPPQVLLARSPRPQIWKYQSQDRTIRQKYRMWGPLAIATPRG
jgi:hypothetical protein